MCHIHIRTFQTNTHAEPKMLSRIRNPHNINNIKTTFFQLQSVGITLFKYKKLNVE